MTERETHYVVIELTAPGRGRILLDGREIARLEAQAVHVEIKNPDD